MVWTVLSLATFSVGQIKMKRISTMITICEHYIIIIIYLARATQKKQHNNNNKYLKCVSLARRNFSFVDNNRLGSCSGLGTYRSTPISCEKIILCSTGYSIKCHRRWSYYSGILCLSRVVPTLLMLLVKFFIKSFTSPLIRFGSFFFRFW